MEQSHVQIYLKAGAAVAISKCRKALEDELFVDRLLSYFGIKSTSLSRIHLFICRPVAILPAQRLEVASDVGRSGHGE